MSRNGGALAVETLTALGARTVFGVPGQHALALFDALARSPLRFVGGRTELNAAYAADGHARVTGAVTPLIVSTGPGALNTLAALQEAAAASVPVLGISSQIPRAGLGGVRGGYLHELTDQLASFRDVVKYARVVRSVAQLPAVLAQAWEAASTAPCGPVWVEIPQDVLLEHTDLPAPRPVEVRPRLLLPRQELLDEAAALLARAERPVILAGGGVVRSGATAELLTLAERLRAPVVTTFGGKGAFPWHHPLSARSFLEDRHTTEFLADADVLLVAGSGLGDLSTNYRTFRPRGHLVHVDADADRLGANYPALALHADAREALHALADAVPARAADGRAEESVRTLLALVEDRLAKQDLELEQGVLASVRAAVPDDVPTVWDMTILGYWAWSAWDPRTGGQHSGQGAGGLGYGLPAALGAAVARGGPVLAVSGDGGAMYSLSELATLRQHDLPVTWLVVDDGGYGILREYMTDEFGSAFATELTSPDFVALAASFGVPAVLSSPETLHTDLAEALAATGPSVVVLPATPRMFAPTHL
ncbi:thiamine pyrophosphate-binding protein [Actinophytocola oryzae]|uniref:Acetolactate synthase-1/2/3 large subunit n=1 Tax=Actinophytocola oryzae TaxID=502181 RepID=A0A4R7UU57_9PSEU|nr:thiamine pyrophosphate-binding protein [Actinophytocola oryzae]TDV38597.1 acetolactate synthase-1/2/3 large subunit [Actinophytocola oryzae]